MAENLCYVEPQEDQQETYQYKSKHTVIAQIIADMVTPREPDRSVHVTSSTRKFAGGWHRNYG